MVLWELSVATAYFLGLKRTYRIALRLQRRVVGPRCPKIKQFLYRRTRTVFDVAVKVHKSIQQRDLEAGRSIGSRLLLFLDRIKPSARIRMSPEKLPINSSAETPAQPLNSSSPHGMKKPTEKDNQQLFASLRENFPAAVRMKPSQQAGIYATSHHICSDISNGHSTLFIDHRRRHHADVFRRDIALWMHPKK